MIGYLKGKVVDSDPGAMTVAAGGVGYLVSVIPELVAQAGAEVELFVHTHVTQEGISLYGFATPADRDLFLQLLRVQGLGPTGSLKVMAGFPPDELRAIIESGDTDALQRIKGIGPKLADKIVFFLRGKLPEPEMVATVSTDAVAALVSLGMKEAEARKAAAHALKELGQSASVEEVVRHALRSER